MRSMSGLGRDVSIVPNLAPLAPAKQFAAMLSMKGGFMQAPKELRVASDRRQLTVIFDSETHFALSAEMLRVMSPSAEVQGHSPEQRVTVGGKKDVAIARIEPVGNYAIRIGFDDGHDTGIFTWDYLAELGRERDGKWAVYLDELAARGLRRER